MTQRNYEAGITLVEVLVGLGLLLILGMMAAPSLAEFQERQRLKAAAEALANSLNLARSEALAQQQFFYVAMSGQGTERWCYTVSSESGCDCQSACQPLQKTEGTAWPGVSLGGTSRKSFRFNWKNASATGANGTATLIGSRSGQRLCVVLSNLGRVRILTSKDKPVSGYPQDAVCR